MHGRVGRPPHSRRRLPLGQVVQTGGDRYRPCASGLGYEDVQDGREGGELGGHVLARRQSLIRWAETQDGTPSLVDPLEPDDGFGHPL
ncbi:hypothetical protein SVIOM342S_03586 [Streptomyces violaceorubidus]